MLELRNLTKTYVPKKGAPVQALKGINLSFGERGLVFVLGKSGSGKSTLLNLIGGLDTADGGEIIIEGKSSQNFKASDYDAYRNTYIGFVFQEYNLLDDFTVGENISLALELQSQKADKQRLDEILKEVDLEGYADRKTNELSGGQKQRVAIARALVKSPKIIMADEPTGALDSATGKAILETLKRLSQDKLVIVVSHDREFAEEYGDRVIELADGEIVGDTAKSEELRERGKDVESKGEMKKSRLPYKRALAMGAKTMRKKRMRLVVTIMLCIVSFTLFGVLDVALSFDRDYTAQSALLLRNNDYISFNSCINYRKGMWDWNYSIDASYGDLEKLRSETGIDFQGVIRDFQNGLPLYDSDLLNGGSKKEYYFGRWGGILPASQSLFDMQGYKLYGRMPENKNEIVITKHIFDQFAIAGVSLSDGGNILPEEINDIQGFLDKEPLVDMRYIVYYPQSLPTSMTSRTIVGVVDTYADPDGRIKGMRILDKQYYSQICRQYFNNGYHSITFVHQSLYDACLNTMRKPDSTGFGRTVSVYWSGAEYRFNGVATDEALKYTDKIAWLDGKGDRTKLADNEIVISLSQANYLWPEMLREVEERMPSNYNNRFINGMVSFSNLSLYDFRRCASLTLLCEEAENISLEELEIYKQYCIDNDYIFHNFGETNGKYFSRDVELRHIDEMTESDWRVSYACYLSKDKESKTIVPGYVTSTGEVVVGEYYDINGGRKENVTGRKCGVEIASNSVFIENRIAYGLQLAQRDLPSDYKVIYSGIGDDYALPEVEFESAPKIVGIYYPKEGYPDDYVINNVIYENSLDYEDMTYAYLIAPMPNDKDTVSKLVDIHYDVSTRRGFASNNVEFTAVNSVANGFNFDIPYFRIAGIIIGVFSVLLLGNYIAVSIASKKREIGILRALGARKSDIFAIFINECIIITAIVLILSILGLTIACAIINSDVTSLGVKLTVVHVGIRQIGIIFALGVGATLVASAIPLYKLSKKKPIDSISDR